jgi:hypothetical protein
MGVQLPTYMLTTSKHKLLKDNSDILGGSVAREMSDYCPDGFIRLRMEGKIVEVVAGQVGQHDLEVQHAVCENANAGSRGTQ